MITNYKSLDGMVITNESQKPALKKVYLVDDEFAFLLSLNRLFTNKGCYVRTFSESKPLFVALLEALPDVIVMDVNLHKEDGRQLCRQIKTLIPTTIPIVMFSALSGDIKDVKDSCADYFIQQSSIYQQVLPMLQPTYHPLSN